MRRVASRIEHIRKTVPSTVPLAHPRTMAFALVFVLVRRWFRFILGVLQVFCMAVRMFRAAG